MKQRKKILILVDSFKGCLTSSQAADAIEAGLLQKNIELEIIKTPIADGGEGTVDALVEGAAGENVFCEVKDPLNRKIKTYYGLIENGKTAVIEMAAASGITLLTESEKNPMQASTFGTGQLILDALDRGCKNIFIGIGGSVTNDGGAGMATALGARLLDKNSYELSPVPDNFFDIYTIDINYIDPRLNDTKISILSDVNNPLCGPEGASLVYGPQKGADEKMAEDLDKRMTHYADLVEKEIGKSFRHIKGAGAAGGLGFGLLAFCNAKMLSGTEFIADKLKIEEKIKTADIIITGEGKVDRQTEFNKLPVGIARIAKKYNKKCICIAGVITDEARSLKPDYFDEMHSIVNDKISKEESMRNPTKHLTDLASKISLSL